MTIRLASTHAIHTSLEVVDCGTIFTQVTEEDLNGDGNINQDDRAVIGSPHPDFTAGLDLGLRRGNWDFSATLFGTFGNQIFDVQKYWYVFRYFNTNVRSDRLSGSAVLDGPCGGASNTCPGRVTNPGAKYPRLDVTDVWSRQFSSYYVEDGSYVRLRNVQIGYNLPPALIHDPDYRSGPLRDNLTEAHTQIQDALRMGNTADERIAWDLKDDGGTRRDAFNDVVHMGRRKSPKEILREYQVTDDPRGVTDYFGEQITQGEENLLSDLSVVEKSDFKDIKERAWAECEARFPEDDNDGHMDAFRHAYWNALMTKRFGPEWAEQYGTSHERLPGNPKDREAMDLYNNEVGRRIAMNNPNDTPAQLAAKIQSAVQLGTTVVMGRDGNLVASDKVDIGRHGHSNGVPGGAHEGRDPGDPGPGS